MDSTRKWFNLGSSVLALFIVGLLLGSMTTAWAEPAPMSTADKNLGGSYVHSYTPYIAPGSSGTWIFWMANYNADG